MWRQGREGACLDNGNADDWTARSGMHASKPGAHQSARSFLLELLLLCWNPPNWPRRFSRRFCRALAATHGAAAASKLAVCVREEVCVSSARLFVARCPAWRFRSGLCQRPRSSPCPLGAWFALLLALSELAVPVMMPCLCCQTPTSRAMSFVGKSKAHRPSRMFLTEHVTHARRSTRLRQCCIPFVFPVTS